MDFEEDDDADFEALLSEIAAVEENSTSAGDVELRAAFALVSSFDVNEVQRLVGDDDRRAAAFLESDCDRAVSSESMRFRLRLSVRQSTLKGLESEGRLETIVDVADSQDRVRNLALAYIAREPPDLDHLGLTDLYAVQESRLWLQATNVPTPSDSELRRATARQEVLEPLSTLLSTGFVGRELELDLLARYVEQPAESDRIFRGVARGDRPGRERRVPIAISGPGGVGKSTLIARFLTSAVITPARTHSAFVYLSFDRSDLSIREPLSLIRGALTQFYALEGVEVSDSSAIRYSLNLDTAGPPGQGLDAAQAEIRGAIKHYVSETQAAAGNGELPLIWTFDTFEVPQREEGEYLEQFWRFVAALYEEIPNLRVVICGRAPLDNRLAVNIQLSEFTAYEAESYLALQLDDLTLPRDFLRELQSLLNSLPLTLRLAVDLVRRERELVQTAEGRNTVLELIRNNNIEGVLFRRVLDHIEDRDIRRLVHPGLVVRRVDADVIKVFLAEDCGLGRQSESTASSLFERLRKEVGVVVDGGSHVSQRPELRRVLLAMIRADKPAAVEIVLRNAIRYYRSEGSPEGRVECVYYMLLAGESVHSLDSVATEQILRRLERDELEFPPISRRYIASRLGRIVDDEIRVQSRDDVWALQAVVDARRLRNEGKPQQAIEVLNERSNDLVYPVTVLERAQTLAELGLVMQARQVAQEAVSWSEAHNNSALLRSATLMVATIQERLSDFNGAVESYLRVAQLSATESDEEALIEAMAGSVRQSAHGAIFPQLPTVARRELIKAVARLGAKSRKTEPLDLVQRFQVLLEPSEQLAKLPAPQAPAASVGPVREYNRSDTFVVSDTRIFETTELAAFSVRSFRYLRLTIAGAGLSVLISVLLAAASSGCWQISVRNYYYGPSHTIYIGALFLCSGCVLALQGNTSISTALLKVVAGLGPVIAITPPPRPLAVDTCSSVLAADVDQLAVINNNFVAVALSSILLLGVVVVQVRVYAGRTSVARIDYPQRIGTAIALGLLLGGLVWYFGFRDGFLESAHTVAAMCMVVLLLLIVLIDAQTARPGYRVVYSCLFAIPLALAVAVSVASLILTTSGSYPLILELGVLMCLVVYWLLQAVELWDTGVPTGVERSARHQAARWLK